MHSSCWLCRNTIICLSFLAFIRLFCAAFWELSASCLCVKVVRRRISWHHYDGQNRPDQNSPIKFTCSMIDLWRHKFIHASLVFRIRHEFSIDQSPPRTPRSWQQLAFLLLPLQSAEKRPEFEAASPSMAVLRAKCRVPLVEFFITYQRYRSRCESLRPRHQRWGGKSSSPLP